MFFTPSKSILALQSKKLRLIFVAAAILLATGSVFVVLSQHPSGQQIVFPVAIQWNKQSGVTSYRLQIATDEKFQDVISDKRVTGNRYLVDDLAPGYYYWRVAPANSQLGAFSRPQRLSLSGGVVTPVRPANRAR